MENQYCRVGAVTSIEKNGNAIRILEHLYQNFFEKAGSTQYKNTQLGDFFEAKARKIKTMLDALL
ncbi:hypothetical protein U1E44_13060 [Arenibacter sp. GZD96]|uniref:hypothetical protein n=1 Tax=Aurantibrevibacter litoralis TaxID=3106030 RepID=UPI002AFFC16C|nr:hypothetical protein [Arenibacter sp. GZD-96]MEA1787023.1 hypothetical protein [Arenibacter sp. GZD-96]